MIKINFINCIYITVHMYILDRLYYFYIPYIYIYLAVFRIFFDIFCIATILQK